MTVGPATRRADGFRGRALRCAAPIALALVLVAAWAPGVAAANVRRHHPPKPTHIVTLSNERTFTRYAEANYAAKIYAKPNTRARTFTRLRYFTPDEEAVQSYLVLRQERIGRRTWVHLRVPMRPDGRTGWVLRRTLSRYWVVHTQIVVDRRRFTLTVYRRGKRVFETPVGVGKNASGWGTTPAGHFWIAESFPSSDPFYGPWAFGTTDYANNTDFPDGSIVGIHGTNTPALIPGPISHGCIRLRDAMILKLRKYISIGTALWVR